MSKISLRALSARITLGALCLAALTTAAAAQIAEVSAVSTPFKTYAVNLQSITVKAPAAGNMIVTAAGQVDYVHTSLMSEAHWCVALSLKSGDIGGCTPIAGSSAAARNYVSPSAEDSDTMVGTRETYSIVHVYPVTSGTEYTFNLNGSATGFSSASLFQPSLTAEFVSGTLPDK